MVRLLLAIAIGLSPIPTLAAVRHQARLPAPAAEASFVVRDVHWRCAGDLCSGGPSASRPATVCESLAKRVGRLDSFSADGKPMDAAALESCNAKAR